MGFWSCSNIFLFSGFHFIIYNFIKYTFSLSPAFKSSEWSAKLGIDLMILLAAEIAEVTLTEIEPTGDDNVIETQLYKLKSWTSRIIQSKENEIDSKESKEMLDLIPKVW